ncbi:MAG: hypothetical protein ACOYL6_09910 [Bacteriovoracaceae bacterium]
MSTLFLDTSHHLTLGLLNEKFQWLDYRKIEGGKTATDLHHNLYQMLTGHKLQLKNLSAAIQIAGPGSYTGMRVSDGLFQSLKLFGLNTHSIYHFDVPHLLGKSSGLWLSNAFKGEIFSVEWDGEQKNQNLMSEKDFISRYEDVKNTKLYTHHITAFSPTFSLWVKQKSFCETSALIQDCSELLFPQIVQQNVYKPIFYYRPIEQEFKKPN